ncbi:hypothetical protein ACF0H5_008568 [Mactra antiquata]
MDLMMGLVFVAALLLATLFLRRQKNLPPGYFAVPLLGSLSLLSKLKNKKTHLVLLEESKKLGSVFRFSIGNRLIVVLSGYDTIHEALVVKKEAFSGRPNLSNPAISNVFDDEMRRGGIILRPYGDGWRNTRRFTLQALRDFGVGKSSIEEKLNEELNAVTSYLDSFNGKPASIRNVMQKAVTNVIFSIVFGKRYDYDDTEFDEVQNMTNTIVTGSGVVNPNNFLPSFMARILNRKETENDKLREKSFRGMRDYVYEQIDEHENTYDESNIRDFVDFYIQASRRESTDNKHFISKPHMFRIIFDLFIAGSETTSTSLLWAFLCLIEFPDVQKRCREEITKVLGGKPVQYSDKNNLPYINAVITETQRFGNILPLNVIHSTTKDTTLHGYNIPQDTLVIPFLYSVSLDEKYFPEPTKFNPDRFIDSNGKLIRNDAAIPFSTGPRSCLGEPLARMELFMVVANLLQKFVFEREDPEICHSFDIVPNQVTISPLPYKLRATRIQ